MYKVIDLGTEVASTGEPRVRTLETSLVKTASSEIQEYWDTLKQNDEYAYLWVIGVSAMEYYGCNNNGDAFTEADLKKTIPDWTANAHIFLHHVNKDPNKSIGKPVYAWYNNNMHRVELVLAIDKSANGAAHIVERIKNGDQLYVSMGCNVKYDVCSICGHQSKSRAEYCDHLRFNMKKILPDGQQVYALNPNPKFFDISIVTKPADPTAFALDKIASADNVSTYTCKTAAELGEESVALSTKVASLHKMADILKQVEGCVVASKSIDAVKDIARCGFDELDYPEIPYHRLEANNINPLTLLHSLAELKSPVTLGDAYWMSGLPKMGIGMGTALHLLPDSLDMLADNPDTIPGIIHRLFAGQTPPTPMQRTITIRIIRQPVVKRITLITRLNKFAEQDIPANRNFFPIEFEDENGKLCRTTPYHIQANGLAVAVPNGKFTTIDGKYAKLLKALGAMGLLASLGNKSITGSTLSLLSLIAGLGLDRKTSKTNYTGVEVPANAWRQPIEKTGEKFDLPLTVGLLAPAALALDYAYNKWKAEKNGMYPEDSLSNEAGYFVSEHPVLGTVLGGVAGRTVSEAARSLFKR